MDGCSGSRAVTLLMRFMKLYAMVYKEWERCDDELVQE